MAHQGLECGLAGFSTPQLNGAVKERAWPRSSTAARRPERPLICCALDDRNAALADISAVAMVNSAHDGGKKLLCDATGGKEVNTGRRLDRQDSLAGFGRSYSRS